MYSRTSLTIFQIGCLTLDNAENNATMMQALQTLFAKRELKFSASNNRVRCFAHIINLCSSHVIAAFTPNSSRPSNNEFDDGQDTSESDDGVDDLVADPWQDSEYDSECDSEYDPNLDPEDAEGLCDRTSRRTAWSAGLKLNPLGRARRIIRTLRASDQRRQRFSKFIDDGNKHGWFHARDKNGKRIPGQTVQLRNVQLLRDVKTRWDSVYLMLQRLRELRAVSFH